MELCMEKKKRRKTALLQLMRVFFIINPGEVTNQRGFSYYWRRAVLELENTCLWQSMWCVVNFVPFLPRFVLFDHFIISSVISMWLFLNGLLDVVLLRLMTSPSQNITKQHPVPREALHLLTRWNFITVFSGYCPAKPRSKDQRGIFIWREDRRTSCWV